MNLLWYFIRMAQWARRRPPKEFIRAGVAVLILAAVLVTIERTVGWPAWLTVNKAPHFPLRPFNP